MQASGCIVVHRRPVYMHVLVDTLAAKVCRPLRWKSVGLDREAVALPFPGIFHVPFCSVFDALTGSRAEQRRDMACARVPNKTGGRDIIGGCRVPSRRRTLDPPPLPAGDTPAHHHLHVQASPPTARSARVRDHN